jgi:uncharacterized membrane protein
MARQSTPSPASPPKVKKTRWYHQVWQAYTMTRKTDPAVTWFVLGSIVGILAVGLVIGLIINRWLYMLLLSLPFAVLAGMFILARRAARAAPGWPSICA